MLIGKDYKVEADSLNVTVSKRMVTDGTHHKTKIAGREYWSNVGYYATVKGALKGLVDMGVADTELVDLKTVVAKIDELKKHIDRLPDIVQ